MQPALVRTLSRATLEHLRQSGLTDETIEAAGIRDAKSDGVTAALLEKYKVAEGYLLPYFDFDGAVTEHWRIRVLERAARTTRTEKQANAKYLQARGSGNQLYLPPSLSEQFGRWWQTTDPSVGPLYIVEGEKKALAGAQVGLLTIAVGGVYSWRSQTFKFPRDAVKVEDGASFKIVKLDANQAKAITTHTLEEFAQIEWANREVYIVFDSDAATNPDVASAAFDLESHLEEQGAVPYLLNLPAGSDGAKVGLDDFLISEPNSHESLQNQDWLVANRAHALPLDPRASIRGLLNEPKGSRSTAVRVARIALRALDSWGRRYRDDAGAYYYFHSATRVLHEFRFDEIGDLRQTSFGSFLIDELGLNTSDSGVMSRLADFFAALPPIQRIVPRRVVYTKHDDVHYYQLNDGEVARVSVQGVEIVDNGSDGVLFLAGQTKATNADQLIEELNKPRPKKGWQPKWYEALKSVNLQPMEPLTEEETRKLVTCLFYMSPWLNRWRGLMLPLEIFVAEPNSGKTFLFNLRRGILTGHPGLAGLPEDFRSFIATVSAAPGLWVADNLGSAAKNDYWHRLNDELARLLTDPYPTIETRRLYTTSTLDRVPVNCTFAITTIKNPFTAPDVLQRSFVFDMSAIPVERRNGDWYHFQLEKRLEWLAEHLNVLARFFQLVKKKWQEHYVSGYRLVGFQQTLLLMGEALGWDLGELVERLSLAVSATIAEQDPVMEGLLAFSQEYRYKEARLREIVNWVEDDEDHRFKNVRTFGNVVLLGRYVASHAYDLAQSTGMETIRRKNVIYLLLPGDRLEAKRAAIKGIAERLKQDL